MNKREKRPSATQVRTVLNDGRIIGIDDSVWCYRKIDMETFADARTYDDKLAAAQPLYQAMNEMSKLVHGGMPRRSVAKSNYRQIHILGVNVPAVFTPDPDQPLHVKHSRMYPNIITTKRVLLFGVRLNDSVGKNSGGLRETIKAVTDVLVSGTVSLADYESDFYAISEILTRCGLSTPTPDDLRLANGWWNYGSAADVPYLPHPECLNFFTNSHTAQIVERVGVNNRENWPDDMPGHHAITFTSASDFEFNYDSATSNAAMWASQLYDNDATVISIRGSIEPRKITQAEVRKRRRAYLADIEERAKNNKMSRAEQEERFEELKQIEAVYADEGAPPTLIESSIIVGFNGEIEDVKRITADSSIVLNVMQNRQDSAWVETMMASAVRANPNIHDIPSHVIALSGLQSLSSVGDDTGAILGFTERDRQPAYLDPFAASDEDTLPIMLVAGATGSGKALSIYQLIMTPTGVARMGDLRVGDEVICRDGTVTEVTYLSPIIEKPDLYAITLSDGQVIKADFDHQWVVSSHKNRNTFKDAPRKQALENYRIAHEDVATLRAFADAYDGEPYVTLDSLFGLVKQAGCQVQRWNTTESLYSALHMMDAPYETRPVRVHTTATERTVTKTDPSVVFDLHAGLRVCIDMWENMDVRNAARWGELAKKRARAARAVLEQNPESYQITSSHLIDLITAQGVTLPKSSWRSRILKEVKDRGVETTWGKVQVVQGTRQAHTRTRDKSFYPVAHTIGLLAERVRQQYDKEPKNAYDERRMTTGEILAESEGKTQKFAIHVAEPLQLPEVDLPVGPYTFGAWLGDGFSGKPAICSMDRQIIDEISKDGYNPISKYQPNQQNPDFFKYAFGATLRRGLGKHGFIAHKTKGELSYEPKHIPMIYQRASYEQRLAVVQGLMDTDGTISTTGNCELSLSSERLATDALSLIRSLGIKASMSASPAGYKDDAGEYVPCNDRYRITFTTTQQVFRLDRKRECLPETIRDSAEWLYIESIEPIEPEPARCITVAHPDATYLCGDFVPTSNTMVALHLADQFVDLGCPVIFIDPKMGSDHSRAVMGTGKGHVSSLDNLTKADGIFDPIRFSRDATVGVNLALTMLIQIEVWGSMTREYETELMTALAYGVNQGGECIGQALAIARDAGRVSPEICNPVFELIQASSTFRACVGMEPQGQGLSVSDGINLIKVGNYSLDLPAPGHPPKSQNQRINVALVHMMVFGSAMALTNRRGVIFLDEAWVFMESGNEEIVKLGRLARSQRVFPILLTQRISDASNKGLEDFISRVLIGAIESQVQAREACRMAKLDPTPERIERITAPALIGQKGAKVPNFNSMKALRVKATRETLRGSVYIYSDLAKRAVPVEIKIPPEFLAIASTNAIDINIQRAKEGLPPLEGTSDAESDES